MNLNVSLNELLTLKKFVQKQQNEMTVSNLEYIIKTYKNIIESIPYNWHFAKNLFYNDIENMLDGSGNDLDCLCTNLELVNRKIRNL